jgi:hypothetical protein
MQAVVYEPWQVDQAQSETDATQPNWIWHGLVGPGIITLLTSRWKAGKTTLLAGLLHALGRDREFLGRASRTCRVIVISEEPRSLWAMRHRTFGLGPHVRVVSRPFPARPTPEHWDELIRHAEADWATTPFELLVVDPAATFLPGRGESDSGTWLDLLNPLRRLAALGVAVLILHHPRKEQSEEGSSARGSGVLLGFVDVILEMTRYGRMSSDTRRRRLIGFSRYAETPESIVYEWKPGTAEFHPLPDAVLQQYKENWPTIESILRARKAAATHRELLMDWPPEQTRPSERQLYEWLSRAFAEKLTERIAAGTKNSPYRFRLKEAEDAALDDELIPLDRDFKQEALIKESIRVEADEAARIIRENALTRAARAGKPEPLACVEPDNVLSEPPESMKELFNRWRPGTAAEKEVKDGKDENEEDDDDLDDFPPSMRGRGPWAR